MIETNQFKLADFCIVSTQAMQVVLKVRKIKSVLIRDFPGSSFTPKSESDQNIKNSEKPLSITVPLNRTYRDDHHFLNYIGDVARILNENQIKTVFNIFGSFKNNFFNEFSNQLNNSDNKLKFIEFRFYPINSYNYSSIVKSCDLAVIFEGSKFGLDLTCELIQVAACNAPVVVYKYGCVCEIFKGSEGAFFFENKDQFVEVFTKIFIQKKFGFHRKSIHTSIQFNWSESWNNSVLKYINSN